MKKIWLKIGVLSSLILIGASGGIIGWVLMNKLKSGDINWEVTVKGTGSDHGWHPDKKDLIEKVTQLIDNSNDEWLKSAAIKKIAKQTLQNVVSKAHIHDNDTFEINVEHNEQKFIIKIKVKSTKSS